MQWCVYETHKREVRKEMFVTVALSNAKKDTLRGPIYFGLQNMWGKV